MPDSWHACSRARDNRIHKSQAEADACPFDPALKHFSNLPPYPPLMRKGAPVAAAQATHAVGQNRAATAVTVDDEDDLPQSPAPLAPAIPTTPPSVPFAQRRGQTPAESGSSPGPQTPQGVYPTPTSQPKQQLPELNAGMMPLSRLRLRALDAQEAKSTTPTGFVAETPRPGSAASAALPGVRQSIEVGHPPLTSSPSASAAASASVLVPASEHSLQLRQDTREINHLRTQNVELADELNEQTALSRRLFTRKQVEAASRRYAEARAHAEQTERHGTQAELQLAYDQLEASQRAVAAAEAKAEKGKAWKPDVTARGVLHGLLTVCAWLVVVRWLWCWVNRVDMEYINGRMRAYYGLGEAER